MHRHHHLLLSLITVMTILTSAEAKGMCVDMPAGEQDNAVGNRPIGLQGGLPRLVVNLMIDGLRSDYLSFFSPLYGNDGLNLLFRQGTVYSQAQYPSLIADRATAAATLSTGTTPSDHGIIARRWLNRETLRPLYAVEDRSVRGLNTVEQYSPRWLEVSTLGDELKAASGSAAQVVSIAPDADVAILLAGHAADQVVWLDDNTGNWSSSDYYGRQLPKWADQRNTQQNLDLRLRSTTWTPIHESVVASPLLLSVQKEKTLRHTWRDARRFADFKTSALINDEVAAATVAALNGSQLGADAVPDLLNITLYAGTYRNEAATRRTLELQDTYTRLDRAVATIIEAVHRQVGVGNALFALTSSGCFIEAEEERARLRLPNGTVDMRRTTSLLGMYLVATYGQGNYIEATFGSNIYLNHALITERQLNLTEVRRKAQAFLLELSGIKAVFTTDPLLQGAWTPESGRRASSLSPYRSGDLILQLRPGWHLVHADDGTTSTPREAFTAFPIILYGTGVRPSFTETPVTTDVIAPTLSKAMRIRAPNACRTAPLL